MAEPHEDRAGSAGPAAGLSPYADLVEASARSLFRVVYRMVGNAHDAEDLTQEALFRGYRALDSYSSDAHFTSAVHRIAINLAIDHTRRRRRWKTRDLETYETTHPLTSGSATPERALASDEIGTQVEAALERLTPAERAAFTLRHYEGLALREIAELTDTSVGNAKNRLFRAVRKLRAALAPLKEAPR